MVSRTQTALFLISYIGLRLLSFFYLPGTVFNSAVSILIILTTILFFWKKEEYAWQLIAAEILLGGTGNFFKLHFLSLRTCLLLISIFIFFIKRRHNIKKLILQHRYFCTSIFFLCLAVGLSALQGLRLHHPLTAIRADVVPYLFLLYFFPLTEQLLSIRFKKTTLNLLFAALLGNLLCTFFIFYGFSKGFFVVHDHFYEWFRLIAGGKAADMGLHFFRIVIDEQLLIAPLYISFFYSLVQKDKLHSILLSAKDYFFSEIILLFILSINLTRSFLLAITCGILACLRKCHYLKWLKFSILTIIFFLFAFGSNHLIASRGASFGYNLLFGRVESITDPASEGSSLSRLLLLPPIIEKIKQRPFFGNGLGDSVTAYSPIIKKNIITPHFDWGYLEIVDELGFIGLVAWISFILTLGWLLYTKNYWVDLVSLGTLLTINLTSPALFHVLGIIWLTYLWSKTTLQSPAAL